MCKGISISKARLRQEVVEQYDLARRITERGGQTELHFMYTDPVVELPVIRGGELVIYEWGNRGNKESKLPRTGWCRNESFEAGKWRWLKPELVEIPAEFGLEKGVWFPIVRGINGVLVSDEQRQPHVYMLTKQASHAFESMTKHDRMPSLIGQDI
jgi:hypothetical protein